MIRLYLVGGAVLAMLLTAGWALAERGGRISAQAEVTAQAVKLQQNEAALDELQAERARTVAALEVQAAAAETRAAESAAIRRTINAAPVTTACVASPALSAALRGLRRNPAGGAGGTPGGPGQSARVPAAARASR